MLFNNLFIFSFLQSISRLCGSRVYFTATLNSSLHMHSKPSPAALKAAQQSPESHLRNIKWISFSPECYTSTNAQKGLLPAANVSRLRKAREEGVNTAEMTMRTILTEAGTQQQQKEAMEAT